MDDFPLLLTAAIMFVAAVALALWCNKRYEIAIFLVALSPWLSEAFVPPTIDVDVVDLDSMQEPALGSYLRIGLLVLTGAVGVFRFIQTWRQSGRRFPVEFLLLGGFLFFALLSSSYSIDQQYTFIRSATFLALFGFLLGLYSWIDSEQRLNQTLYVLFLVVALVTVVNTVALIAFPGRAWYGDRFQGLGSHPNSMGSFCMLAYPLLFWVYPRSTPSKKLIVVIISVTLLFVHLLTGSRGSLMAAIAGLAVWAVVQRKPIQIFLLSSVIAIGAFIVTQVTPKSYERESGVSATDLTDRPELWAAGLTLLRERPILGYGYSVEGGVFSDRRFYQPELSLWSGTPRSSLHNGYLSIAIGLGVGALVVWCVLLLMPLWRFRILPYSDYKGLALAVIVSVLLVNVIESEFGGTVAMFWIVWVVASRVSQALSIHSMVRG